MSVLMVGLLLIGSLSLVAHKARADRISSAGQNGHALARQLMSEIIQSAYEDPNQTPGYGVEAGEGTGNRANWDDLDDYHLLSDSPPKLKDGTAIAGYSGWSRTVDVQYANTGTLGPAGTSSDSGLKRILVRVTDPAGGLTEEVALRASVGNFDHRKLYGREFISRIETQLQIGSDASALIHSGTALFNEPSPNLTNLLTNADFEDGTTGWLSWNCTLEASGTAYTGAGSLKMKSRGTIDATGYQDVTSLLQPGKAYYLEGWARTTSGTNMVALSLKTDGSVSGVSTAVTNSFNVGTAWTKVSGVLAPTWSGTLLEARFRAFTYPDGNTAEFYIDDVVLAELQ